MQDQLQQTHPTQLRNIFARRDSVAPAPFIRELLEHLVHEPKETEPEYQRIDSYGLIGNCRTAALSCKNDGSIDWFCYPNFDSPSVFGRILDSRIGGYFAITPDSPLGYRTRQNYLPNTNVLVTRFMSKDGVANLNDFMPPMKLLPNEEHGWLIRILEVVHGEMRFCFKCFPAFNYAREKHKLEITNDGHRAIFRSQSLSMVLESPNVKLIADETNENIDFCVTLQEQTRVFFVFRKYIENEETPLCLNTKKFQDYTTKLLNSTIIYWNRWVKKSTYQGRWREMVIRSALTLKMLCYEPTGAIIAAPTSSLPETIGGNRNWDYRYVWIRDSSFVLYALLRIGFTDEATAFMKFLEERCREEASRQVDPDTPPLKIMYSIHGEPELNEVILDHLSGYKSSRPVRIGNGAHNQLQLDIFGELLDAIYQYDEYVTPISFDFWEVCVKRVVNWVARNYHLKDESIWEKIMCWVCIDRGIRLADKRSFPLPERELWYKSRDAIYLQIMQNGWDPERKVFTQSFENKMLDASALIMPLVNFISPSDSRIISTIENIMKTPKNGGLRVSSLVYRYDPKMTDDGLCGEDEGTFSICTLWLIEALARAGAFDSKKLHESLFLFENMLTFANHCGLFSEELSAQGESLGNFPQAFTHLAFISCAFNLDKNLNKMGARDIFGSDIFL